MIVHPHVGKGLGSLLGGYTFETYGAVTLFRSCSVASVILVVIYATLHLCFSLRKEKSTPSSSKVEDEDEFEEKGKFVQVIIQGFFSKVSNAAVLQRNFFIENWQRCQLFENRFKDT